MTWNLMYHIQKSLFWILMEIWKFLPGYEDIYSISNSGRVLSHSRYVMGPRGKPILLKEKVMKPGCGRDKYLGFQASKNGKSETIAVHRAVAFLFVENPHNLPVVNHKNGNKLDNSHSNLEWVSIVDNCEHCYATQLRFDIGQKHKNSKLTIDQVKAIISERNANGTSQNVLASKYGTTRENIRSILNGKTWTKALQFDAVENCNAKDY